MKSTLPYLTLLFAGLVPVLPTALKAAASNGPVIPAGTLFRVRTISAIDVDATQAGTVFQASLDDPIMQGGSVLVPRGAGVTLVVAKVQQGGHIKGSDLIELKVSSFTVRSHSYPVVTSMSQTKSEGEGKKSTRKILGGAGLGAAIGAIAGGGTGAGIGALVGAAGGTIWAGSTQPHLKIPPETRLEFKLLADRRIR